jgi:hypothetical protein
VVNVIQRRRFQFALATVAAAGLLVGGLVSLSGARADQSSGAGSPQAVGARAGATLALGRATAGSAIACPALEGSATRVTCGPVPIGLCCGIRSALGVTATGQASLKGSGVQVRDQAIRQAVADAKDQAEAAAGAAGIKLGQILDMQISSSGYPYPLAREGVAYGRGSVAPSPPCASGAACAQPIAIPAETFVSVTVTWAIA